MKLKKKRWLGLAFAPALFALIGFVSPAKANDYNDNCANYPGTFDGTGTVTINNTGACTLNQAINAAGAVSITSSGVINTAFGITGSSVNVSATTGAINAKAVTSTNGNLILSTASAAAVNADIVTSTNGSITVNSGAGATFTNTVQSNFGFVSINAVNDIQTKKVVAEFALHIESTAGKVVVNGGTATSDALVVNNGPMDVTSKDLLTITGLTTSTANELQLQSKLDLKADAISAGSHARINSTDGNINVTSTIGVNKSDQGGNLLVQAKNTVRAGAIKVHGPTTSGIVQIDANTGGGSVLFTIGSKVTNGVTSIDTTATSGGGTDTIEGRRGVWITNGTSNSNGGITLSAAANLKVLNTTSRSGIVWLNAQNGPMTLPGGIAINANGTASFFAGQIYLLSKDLTLGVNPTLQATQAKATAGSSHGVTIATQTITYQGGTGLKILADGDGQGPVYPAYAYIIPQGSISSVMSGDFRTIYWSRPSLAAVQTTDLPVTITGTASSPFTMRANGNDAAIAIRGNETMINTGAIALTSNGRTNHTITVRDTGPFGDTKKLTLGTINTPTVVIDASAGTGFPGTGNPSGGDVVISTDTLTVQSPSYAFKANGPLTGNGGGGTLRIASTFPAVIGTSSLFTLNADAALVGTGDAVVGDVAVSSDRKAIQLYVSGANLDLGASNLGQFALSAQGGKIGGKGGTVIISSGGVRVKGVNAVNASAIAGNSNGGEIYFFSYIVEADPNATMTAIGTGSGKGGRFTAYAGKFDVNAVIKVDAGPTSASTVQDGYISLNGVSCGQWKVTSTQPWLAKYWNCVHPSLPEGSEGVAAREINIATTSYFSGVMNPTPNPVRVYVFNNGADFQAFFNEVLSSPAGAYTTYRGLAIPYSPYINVFLNDAFGIVTDTKLAENAIHETAHAYNALRSEIDTAAYLNYVARDLYYLDYTAYLSTAPAPSDHSHDRHPCQPTGSIPAPFAGVLDSQGIAICDSSNNVILKYANKLNSKIAAEATPILKYNSTGPTSHWEELYAQAFAYKSYVSLLDPADINSTYQYTANHLFLNGTPTNGLMQCTLAWALHVRSGLSADNPNLCAVGDANGVPGWYNPIN